MRRHQSARRRIGTMVVAAGIAWSAVHAAAQSGGQSFKSPVPSVPSLASGFTQTLYGVTSDLVPPASGGVPNILGGVAFAPNGDVWSAECVFLGTRLHRFDSHSTTTVNGTAVHPEVVVDLTGDGPLASQYPGGVGGCGLVNHPNGSMYSSSAAGVWQLDANTGQPTAFVGQTVPMPIGQPGNALGIAVDPQSSHIVYIGADCHPSLADGTSCTLWDLDPATGTLMVFARLSRVPGTYFFDGLYFDPSGQFLFAAHREEEIVGDTLVAHNSLDVIGRPTSLKPATAPADDAQIVRHIAMLSEPDGVAFHAVDGAVVTLNETDDCVDGSGSGVAWDFTLGSCPAGATSIGGTMTRFNYSGADYTQAPTQSLFAAGGFRGDLVQVGPDGCVYATQSPLVGTGGIAGTRYDNGVTTSENSLVRICGNFVPPPGVFTGGLGGVVFTDTNGNGVQDASETRVGNATVTATGTNGFVGTTTTGPDGSFSLSSLPPGVYTVSAEATAGAIATSQTGTVVNGQVAVTAPLAYVPVSILSGGVTETNGTPVTGLVVTLTGTTNTGEQVSSAAITTDSGGFTFTMPPGTYTISVPSTCCNGLPISSASSSTVTVSGGSSAQAVFTYSVTPPPPPPPPPTPLIQGDTATIGFWHNKNGQALINSVNGGPSATALATWLASNFPYLWGANAGANNLTGKTNANVAALFMTFFNVKGAKTDAQMLGVALGVYVTSTSLAGTAATGYGFNVSGTGTGGQSFNVGSNGSAIGLTNNASYTVMTLLQQANLQKQLGTFNANAFNSIFDGINQTGDIR